MSDDVSNNATDDVTDTRDRVFLRSSDEAKCNANSNNLGLVKAVMVAGLYPNVVKVKGFSATDSSKGGKPNGSKTAVLRQFKFLIPNMFFQKDAKEQIRKKKFQKVEKSKISSGRTPPLQ